MIRRAAITVVTAALLAGCGGEAQTCEFQPRKAHPAYRAVNAQLARELVRQAHAAGDDTVEACVPTYLGNEARGATIMVAIGARCTWDDGDGGGYYPAVARIRNADTKPVLDRVWLDASITTNEKWIEQHVPQDFRLAIRCNRKGVTVST